MHTDRHLLRLSLSVGGGLLIVAGIGEAIARFGLGLGSPPLSVAHPRIEYLFRPNQELKRFGNRIAINAYGMRSDLIGEHPPAGVRRVLVFGDSVVFGGAQLDQSLIATERLQASLRRRDPRVQVGNVSAGSWGPGNWRGWADTHGFLGATDVVLVISSHDAADNPTFAPLSPQSHPTAAPASALHELFARYLNPDRLGYQLRSWGLLPRPPQAPPATLESPVPLTSESDRQRGLADLRVFLQAAKASGARVSAVQFWERGELAAGRPRAEHPLIARELRQLQIPVVQSDAVFRSCSAQPVRELYVDDIHPFTPSGQACLARALEQALRRSGS